MADRFVWYELLTTDQKAAETFYTAVVGWHAADAGPPNTGYTILSAGERGMGGVMALPEEARKAGGRPGWIGYIHVADADAVAADIEGAGGTIHRAPDDIPTVGRFAVVADPGGAVFALLSPLPRGDAPPEADPDAPGEVGWRELYSSLGDKAAFDFYAARFGWETMDEMDMGPMGTYRIFGAGGAPMGGMMRKPDNVPASAWSFYFNVDGIDAAAERVRANGGQVLMDPHEVPGGSWIVQCRDPQGANFALVSPTR